MVDRIALLKSYLDEDPTDPFNYYGLALEYEKIGDLSNATALFREILDQFADYLPVYYTSAKYFEDKESPEKVKELYERGIAMAKLQGNTKAFNELSAAYTNYLFEND